MISNYSILSSCYASASVIVTICTDMYGIDLTARNFDLCRWFAMGPARSGTGNHTSLEPVLGTRLSVDTNGNDIPVLTYMYTINLTTVTHLQ